jgi:Flp pilus assembly protein TadG
MHFNNQKTENRNRIRLRLGNRRGAAVVEFAVVSPVLVLMILGIVEFGRMSMVQQTVTTAAREGARHAVVDGSTTTEIKASVTSFLAAGGITGAEVSLRPDLSGTVLHGDPVSVSVSVPFSNVSWLPVPHFLGGKVLSSTAVMRRETPQ